MKHEGFTPGPLSVTMSGGERPTHLIVDASGNTLAEVLRPFMVAQANARLIADAPNLLAERDRLRDLLKRAVAPIEWAISDMDNGDEMGDHPALADYVATLADIRAALAVKP